jgi:hypothetical protein
MLALVRFCGGFMGLSLNNKWNALAVAVVIALFSTQALSAGPDVLRSSASLGVSDSKVKGYREWKSEQVQEALQRVTATKTKLQVTRSKDPNLLMQQKGSTESGSSMVSRLESQLETDQNFLETVKKFSVADYLAGYLMKIQNKKAAFNEVAGKLTSDEIAELLSAYATSAFGTPADLGPSANSATEDKVR